MCTVECRWRAGRHLGFMGDGCVSSSLDWRHLPRETSRFIKQLPDIARVRFGSLAPGQPHTLPGRLVVSLTSHPPRYLTLGLTLRSLLQQDVKPDILVLWLAAKEYRKLPRSVLRLQDHGLMIAICDDIKSYKKVIPALAAFPDDVIVTADDDIHYHRGWLRIFVEAYRNRGEILCQRARTITMAGDHFAPYDKWPTAKANGPHIFPIGFGGILYPPNSLGLDVSNRDEFMRLCPRADDIWLYWSARGRHRLIEPVQGRLTKWGMSQLTSLYRNNRRGGNDSQLHALVQEYGVQANGMLATRPCAALPQGSGETAHRAQPDRGSGAPRVP